MPSHYELKVQGRVFKVVKEDRGYRVLDGERRRHFCDTPADARQKVKELLEAG